MRHDPLGPAALPRRHARAGDHVRDGHRRRDEARRLYDRLLAVRNDVGLLAEQYDPRARRQLGNFPQALSHIALVNSACNLSQSGRPARLRADA